MKSIVTNSYSRVLNLKTLEDDSIEKEPVDLYNWAKLFKATTWEELNRFSCKHEFIWLIANTKTECDLTGRIAFLFAISTY